MGFNTQSIVITFFILTCLQKFVLSELKQHTNENKFHLELKNASCSTNDLNHSPLVECNGLKYEEISNNKQELLWPKSQQEILHIYSTRSGDRFATDSLPNLDFQENELERTLNINTTLYVTKSSTNAERSQEIYGFGTIFDIGGANIPKENEQTFQQIYGPIFKDLYGQFGSANQFTILSILVTRESIVEQRISRTLLQLDALAIKSIGERDENNKVKVILSLDDFESTLDMIEALKATALAISKLRVLQIWAVDVNQHWLLKNSSNEGILGYLQEFFSTQNILARTNMTLVPDFVDAITKSQSILKGLVIKSQYSSPYNIIDYVRKSRNDLKIITVGRDKFEINEYGDWDTANNYAIEILNHLKYGSNGFLEASSVVDILKQPNSQDCSIYSLRQSHDVHFRGPMFYAIGHFSRYVTPGSKLLKTSVFTQPNMFAAHYISFLTPQNYIISIVINDNDHMLPFRLAVDGHILAYLELQSKSFNTIITRQ